MSHSDNAGCKMKKVLSVSGIMKVNRVIKNFENLTTSFHTTYEMYVVKVDMTTKDLVMFCRQHCFGGGMGGWGGV